MSKDNGSKENEIHVEFEQKDAQEPGGETKAFDSVNSKSGKDAKSQITVENGKAPVERCEERGAIKNYTPLSMIWKVLRPLLIFVVSAGLIVYLGITAYRYVENSYFAPVDADSTISKTIEIKTGSSLSTIATTLHEEGIIRNKLVFQLYVDLKDMASSLIARKAASRTLRSLKGLASLTLPYSIESLCWSKPRKMIRSSAPRIMVVPESPSTRFTSCKGTGKTISTSPDRRAATRVASALIGVKVAVSTL